MKKYLLFLSILCINFSIFSSGNNEPVLKVEDKIVVGLILDSPGLGDSSSNDSCYLGLEQAAEEGLITLRVKTSKSLEDSVLILTKYVEDRVDIVYAIGDKNKKLLIDGAKLYKNTTFVGIDILFDESEIRENLYGTTFKEQDGGYLAGLVAGSLTYKYFNRHPFLNEVNRVGIILGKNNPEINSYKLGFYSGVKKVNPPCEIIEINLNDLDNEEKGASAVSELKGKGVDIVFTVAGNSDIGVFKSAIESDILVIAVNKDQGGLNNTLTSIEKKISVTSYLMTKKITAGEYSTGSNVVFGLKEGGISLAPYYNFDKYIPKDLNVLIKNKTEKLIKGSEIIPLTIEEIEFDPEDIPEIE